MCLLKTGACLIKVHFNLFACFCNWIHASLKQVACLTEVAIRTSFTVYSLGAPYFQSWPNLSIDRKREDYLLRPLDLSSVPL